MAVPATIAEYLDLKNDSLTLVSAPAETNDLWQTNGGYIMDGVDDGAHGAQFMTDGEDYVTWSFWMKADSLPATDGWILGQWDASGTTTYVDIGYSSAGRITVQAVSKNNPSGNHMSSSVEESVSNIVGNGWMHIMGTIDATLNELDIFINGVELTYNTHNSVTGSGWAGVNSNLVSSDFYIGNSKWTNLPYGGDIARVKAWNVRLTEAQALEEYNAEVALQDTTLQLGLIRHYAADDDAATTVVVDSGDDGTDLAIVGGPNSEDITGAGQVAAALSLDGVNDQVKGTVPTIIDEGLTQDFTMQIWVNVLSAPAAQDTIFGFESGTATDCGIQIEANLTPDGFTMKAEQSASSKGKTFPSSVITTGVWQCLLVTWTAATNTFQTYYNGAIESDVAQTGGIAGASACMVIGSRCNDARYMHITWDENCIWNRVLTTDEITHAYDLGAAGVEITGTLPDGEDDGGLTPKVLDRIIPRTVPRVYAI